MDYIDSEIQKEYDKINDEKLINNVTIENSKKNFADMLVNSYIGDEIKNCNNIINISYKRKIPFKMRLKNFLNKFKLILNDDDGIG